MINRRIWLGGASALVLVGVAAAAGGRHFVFGGAQPETDAEDFAALLAAVRDDYLSGRIGVHDRWVLSQHEIDTLGKRVKAA